jgi:gliding motility-associated-like protein
MRIRIAIIGLFLSLISTLKGEEVSPVPVDTIGIDIVTTLNATGDSVCADLVVTNFQDLLNFQFSLRFDPNVLCIDCDNFQTEFNGDIPIIDPNFLARNCMEGNDFVSLFWNYPLPDQLGMSVPDGTTIMRFCFALCGDPCETSPIFLSGNPTFIEIVKNDGSTLTQDSLVLESDSVEISSNTIAVFERHCNATTGNADGNITFYPCGGVEPYDWTLDGVPQSPQLENGQEWRIEDVPAGIYVIEVTDANGNTASVDVVIDEGVSSIEFDLIPRDPTCFTRENGRFRVENIMGGISPYTFEWSNFQFGTEEIRNLGAGDYSVTVTDFLGCSEVKSGTLSVDTLFGEVEIIDSAACDGAFGTVLLTASGGDPFNVEDYRFNNFFVPMREFVVQVPAGENEATVEDEAGCRIVVDYEMPTRDGVEVEVTVTDVSCNGEADGLITAVATGSNLYQWELRYLDSTLTIFQGGQNNDGYLNPDVFIRSASNQDTFVLTVRGIPSQCFARDTFIVRQPEPLQVSASESQPTCNGNDGQIDLVINGGNAPFTVNWQDGNMDENRDMLAGGEYAVTITDNRGCQDSVRVTLNPGGALEVNVFVSQAIECGNATNGSVTADPATAGTYTYAWSSQLNGTVISMDQTATGLGAGTYYVTVTNTDLNCEVVDSTILIEPGEIAIEVDSVAPSCAAFTNGRLGITVTNGVAPFEYDWADDPDMDLSKSVLTSIGAGSYAVTVTDGAGCTLDTVLQLEAPSEIIVDVSNLVGLDCEGDVTGEATATASGGNPAGDYTFVWSSGTVASASSTHTDVDLPAGQQWVLVGDGSCPSDTVFFEIRDAPQIELTAATAVNLPTCKDDCDASIQAVADGGNGPYTFQWQDGPSGPNRSNLCAGNYIVDITDSDGCTQTDTIIINNPDTLIATINALTTVELTCEDDPGQVGVSVIGGSDGAYTYAWNNSPSTEAIAPNLQEGVHIVTVTDATGCSVEASYTLTKPEPLIVQFADIDMPGCFGERTCFTVDDASGGLGNNYTFTVNLGPLNPLDSCVFLFAGEYTINVFDSSGRCSIDTLISITQPNPVEVDAGPDVEIDLGEESGMVNVNINADNPINGILWSPIDSLECVTPDCQVVTFSPSQDMTYTVTVVDDQGCIGMDELLVRVNTTRRVVFPNIFSPNNDGANDRFQIGVGNGVQNVNYLRIYNRWGNLMYQEDDFLPQSTNIGGWDGTYKGSDVGNGVYVVIAQVLFTDGTIINYEKSLTLVR